MAQRVRVLDVQWDQNLNLQQPCQWLGWLCTPVPQLWEAEMADRWGLLTASLAVSETLSQGNEIERHTQTQHLQWFEICFLCGLGIKNMCTNSKSLILTVA